MSHNAILCHSALDKRNRDAGYWHSLTMAETQRRDEIPPGTLYMLILKMLARHGQLHGYEIANAIQEVSDEVLQVEEGSLYPALHRLEDRRWVSSYWGTSENNRKAKFYRLTAAGRKQLSFETSRWRQMARAIALVMGEKMQAEGGE